ncbi:MAG: IclR family transcriptional regulator [Leucobacter sp.]
MPSGRSERGEAVDPATEVSRGPNGVKAVERTARVLLGLAAHPEGETLSGLCRSLGEPLATLHRTLAALRSYDLVRETADGRFALGSSTAVLAAAFSEGLDLRQEARPLMGQLRERTTETVHLGVLSGAQIVYIDKLDSPNAVRMVSRVGGTNPAYSTAIGKCILAHSTHEELERVAELTGVQFGVRLDLPALEHEFEQIRESGYGTDLGANEPGICCVGAPIFDISGEAVAGISVTTPEMRFDATRVEDLGNLIAATAGTISERMGFVGRQ